MSIRQNGNKFMADFMSNGVRYRKQFPTSEEAVAWEAELKKRIRLNIPYQELLDNMDGKITIGDLLSKTFARYWKGTANESTQKYNIGLIVNFFGANKPVDKIDALALDELIDAMEKKGLAASTINGRLATISKALTYAKDRGYIHERPKIERKKVSNQRLRFFTEEEEYEMLEALRADGRHDFAHFVEWSIDTGMRPIEARNVPQSSLREDDELGYLIDLRKTKNAYPRTIPLTKRAHNAFAALSSEEFMPLSLIHI